MKRLILCLGLLGCASSTQKPEEASSGDPSVIAYRITNASGEEIGRSHSRLTRKERSVVVVTRTLWAAEERSVESVSSFDERLRPVRYKRLSSKKGRYTLRFKERSVSVVSDLGVQERQLNQSSSSAVLWPADDLMVLALAVEQAGYKPGQAAKLAVQRPRSLEVEQLPLQIFANGKRKMVVQLPDGKAVFGSDGRIDDYVSERGVRYSRVAPAGEPPKMLSLPEPRQYKTPTSAAWKDQPARISVQFGELVGVLSVPRFVAKWKNKRAPGVLLLSELGPHNRHGFGPQGDAGYWQLLDRLGEEGFAVLRLDDRGVGASKAPSADVPQKTALADAVAALEFLKTQPQVDPQRLFIIGHGFGGWDALTLAAHREQPDLAGVALVATPYRKLSELLAARHPGPDAERQARLLIDAAGGGEAAQAQVKRALWTQYAPMKARLHSMASVDIDALLSKVRLPLAIFQGFNDPLVSWKEDAKAIDKAFKKHAKRALLRSKSATLKRPEARLHVYEYVDHQMRPKNNRLKSTGLGPGLEPRFLDELASWMQATAKQDGPELKD